MKNTILVIVIVIVIAVILVIVGGRSGNNDVKPSTSISVSPSTSVSSSASPTATTGAVKTAVPPKTLTYEEAKAKYSGTRIQFDARCQAIPNQITVKNSTAVMLDNRSGDARSFSVGTAKYTIAGYGFRIITATANPLPATLVIDCGSAQNVGKIIVQR